MRNIVILFACIGFMLSCSDKKVKPVVDENVQAESLSMDSLVEDTTKVLTVQLPRLIDSTRQILVHEIYFESINKEIDRYSYKKSSSYKSSMPVNLIFEDVINGKSSLLTNNQVKILSYSKYAGNYILYHLIDRDYNRDGILDGKDGKSLYISNVDGTSFTKITKDKENLKFDDWMNSLSRYYFTTYEDANKDGYFDRKDKTHYYYIEFKEQGYNVVEYNPLEILKK